ncbi:hypothetical protein RGUI_3541 [Rhodovulum sp. P5]|nr:hypothetical protein RGUI_3541 [Rhodovulum sp. P5]
MKTANRAIGAIYGPTSCPPASAITAAAPPPHGAATTRAGRPTLAGPAMSNVTGTVKAVRQSVTTSRTVSPSRTFFMQGIWIDFISKSLMPTGLPPPVYGNTGSNCLGDPAAKNPVYRRIPLHTIFSRPALCAITPLERILKEERGAHDEDQSRQPGRRTRRR